MKEEFDSPLEDNPLAEEVKIEIKKENNEILSTDDLKTTFKKDKRKGIVQANQHLEEKRSNPVTTIQEQEEFINIKYPKTPPMVWSWKTILQMVWSLFKFSLLFALFSFLLAPVPIGISLGISLAIITPLVFNFILRKFNLNQGSMTDIFFKNRNIQNFCRE
jgi:hypothetical protein